MIKYHGHMYYTVADAANTLYVGESAVRKYCQTGKLKAKKYFIKEKHMEMWCITKGALDEFISQKL